MATLHDLAIAVIEFGKTLERVKREIEAINNKYLKREIAQLKEDQVRDNLKIERLEENYKNLKYSVLEQVEGNK